MNNAVFNSDALQLICMLICIAVVVCFFIFRYSKGADISDPKSKIQKLHTFYISGILVFIIIELVTGLCMGKGEEDSSTEILNYVNFAATLSSLIMSVVAIIFTIVSGSRGDEQYKKIDNASDKVTESLLKFSEKTASMDDSIAAFKFTADTLSEKMSSILAKVEGVDKTSKEVLNQIRTAQPSEGDSSNTTNKKGKLNELADFVAYSSYSGKLALWACVLSKEKSRPFYVKEISENADDEAYRYGYIIASISAGIINVKPTQDRHIEVLGYPEELKSLLEKSINETLSSENNISEESKRNMYDSVLNVFKPKE